MASTEEPSGTVLHRLIQEQLRYGNPTDTRTLLAIQQQALRGGSGSNSGPSSGGDMSRSPRSSLESLTLEDPLLPQLSARQEPQGQEHQGDYHHSESGYQLHGEKLPTYEQAKAHSQYLASHWAPAGPIRQLHEEALLHDGAFHEEADLMEQKCSHARSLSEHRMQISLERHDAAAKAEAIKMTSHSYPELPHYTQQCIRSMGPLMDKHNPPPEYSAPIQGQGFIPHQVQEPMQAQQHRYQQESVHVFQTALPLHHLLWWCHFSIRARPGLTIVLSMRKHIPISMSHTVAWILNHISSLKYLRSNKSSLVGVCNVWHTATG